MKRRVCHMNYGKKTKSKDVSEHINEQLSVFLKPLIEQLNSKLDKRLVRTFNGLIQTIIVHRNNSHGLLLSELGGYLLGGDKAPAGTKRISNLIRNQKWGHKLIEKFLWRQSGKHLEKIEENEDTALLVWDDSVWEKPESIAIEGLCAVKSSTASRLKRIKKGFYNPPGRPIFVPGMNWLGIVLLGMKAKPCLVNLKWWTSRGKLASDRRSEQKHVLKKTTKIWKNRVLHVFDRGYAGRPWLEELAQTKARFIVRWPKGYKLEFEDVSKKAWKWCQGKRSLDHKMIRDARRNVERKIGLYYRPINHPNYPEPLWLVVSRQGQGKHPWYLLTNEPITSIDDAWQVIFAYARRWQIEMAWRFLKSELAFESPRLWKVENRLKLLFIATLVFAFLLLMLNIANLELKEWLLKNFCHRTGKRCRSATAPLYRIRSALAKLWLEFPPPGLRI